MQDFFPKLYNAIAGETIYVVIVCIFLGFIGYSIIKKLFKLSIIIFICLAIYIGYIYATGDKELLKDKADKGRELLKNKANSAKKDFEKKVKPIITPDVDEFSIPPK